MPGTTVAYGVAAVDAGGNVGPAATVNLAVPDPTPPGAPGKVAAKLTKDGKVHLSWAAASDNGRVASYRILRAGKRIAQGAALAFVDKSAKPGSGSTVLYSVVAVDLAGNVGPAGKAKPLRAALLRKLGASALKVTRVTVGERELVRVKGKLSDSKARCRLRIGTGTWHACKAKPNGAFIVNLPPKDATPVTLSLRDSLGRTKLQTLRVPSGTAACSPRARGIAAGRSAPKQAVMKLITSRRSALASVAASFVLLALPSLAGAHPGAGPELVQRSGQFVILHADERDGTSTREPMLMNGLRQTPVRAPADVWIEPGSRVRLEGTMRNGALVVGDTLTAVKELAPARLASDTSQAPSTETTAVVQFTFSDQSAGALPANPDATMNTDPKSLERLLPRAELRPDHVPDDGVRARAARRSPPRPAARTRASTTGRSKPRT